MGFEENLTKSSFEHPDVMEDEVLLGNFKDVEGNLPENAEEYRAMTFSEVPFETKRKVRAFDLEGKEVDGKHGLVMKRSEYEKILLKNKNHES